MDKIGPKLDESQVSSGQVKLRMIDCCFARIEQVSEEDKLSYQKTSCSLLEVGAMQRRRILEPTNSVTFNQSLIFALVVSADSSLSPYLSLMLPSVFAES